MRKQHACVRAFSAALMVWFAAVSMVSGTSSSAWAQNSGYQPGGISSRSMSEADREANEQVAFSAETIIDVLRNEPGLMLEVKKMLVRKAFEQGRLLQPDDLSDDAVFQMLREQQSVRILATQQIEERSYIRAKPTREEMARDNAMAAQYGTQPYGMPQASNSSSLQAAAKTGSRPLNQEQAYWATHDTAMGTYAAPIPSQPSIQTIPPAQVPPQEVPARPPEQQLNRAGLEQDSQGQFPNNSQTANPEFAQQSVSSSQGSLMNASAPAAYPVAGPAAGNSVISGPRSSNQIAATDPVLGFSVMPDLDSSSDWNRDFSTAQPQPQPANAIRTTQPSRVDLNQDRPTIRTQPNPYADVPSLYDLYQQVTRKPGVLVQFGMDVFRTGPGNTNDLPMDMPVGPDYVLGPGDGLNISLWGAVSQRLKSVVDRQGQLVLPEVGTVQVSGRTLGDVQRMVQSILRTQFRDVEADVSLARIRSVRVYVVGDVERPGAYDISSLSTPLNGLYYAGGPTSRGSLRHIRHYRGDQLIQEVDAYDLLLNGVHKPLASIQSGDTILVPSIGGEITLEGMVRRPGIYELANEKSLAEVLQLAGGVLPSGTLRHVDVERVEAHQKRTMLQLDIPESNDAQSVNQALQQFQVQDGDRIRISPILPYADKTVYLDGHVFHPGKYPYRDGMKITDLIHSFTDLLPEPSQRHAEIIRLEAPDFRPVVLAFNLGDAMSGKTADISLKPFDTVRIFSRFDFEDQPQVTVVGAIRDPGDHITNGDIHLRDAIYLAGGATPDADLRDAQIYRKTGDGNFEVLSVNLSKALTGDSASNILLHPKDRVLVPRNQQKTDPASVQIEGEVSNPGRYPLGKGMTVATLLQVAGGFKRGADTELAELTTYVGPDGRSIGGEHQPVQIARALAGDADADVALHDGDVLTVRQQANWNVRGAYVTLNGEFVHPGTYGIREGERLSSVIQRAGGFRAGAYPYGAILQRMEIRDIEDKDRADLISRVQQEGVELQMLPDTDPEQKMAKGAALLQYQAALEKLQGTPPAGRLVIHISRDSKQWVNTPWDIPLHDRDTLIVPRSPNFVMVNGAIYNQAAITYRAGKNAAWYLHQAGGPTNIANKKHIFLLRADGTVVGTGGGLFSGSALDVEVHPGDMIMVPEKALSGNSKWRQTLEASQLVSAIGVAVTLARGF